MKYLPLTLIIVLGSSLFVALVINPVLASRFMKVDEKAEDRSVRLRKARNVLIGVFAMLSIGTAAHFGEVLWVRNIMAIVVIITLLNQFILRDASLFFPK